MVLAVVDLRLGDGELATPLDHLAPGDQVTRQRGAVVVHPQVNGRHTTASTGIERPVGAEIDEGRENTTVGVATLRVDHPLLTPLGLDLDSVRLDLEHLQANPGGERSTTQEVLA